jgi:hypothetical protein
MFKGSCCVPVFLQSSQPLLLALHDLALLVIADFPPNCAEALSRLKQQLQQEALLEAHVTLPEPGKLRQQLPPHLVFLV